MHHKDQYTFIATAIFVIFPEYKYDCSAKSQYMEGPRLIPFLLRLGHVDLYITENKMAAPWHKVWKVSK